MLLSIPGGYVIARFDAGKGGAAASDAAAALIEAKRAAGVMEVDVKARITVTLKHGVLDPQGEAIRGALGALGFAGVGAVRQGKLIEIELDASDRAEAEAEARAMCEALLANPVIERYAVEIEA